MDLLDGFADAQRRLRDKVGMQVSFFTPVASSYPAGTPLNPETGRPYDPTIKPLASGFTSAAVKCSIVRRPFGAKTSDITETTALGLMGTENVGLIMGSASWPPVSAATEFEVFDARFEIRDTTYDGIGVRQRRIVIGEEKS